MKKYEVAVLGGGHGVVTFAGDLIVAGHTVNLCELTRFKANLDPIEEAGARANYRRFRYEFNP